MNNDQIQQRIRILLSNFDKLIKISGFIILSLVVILTFVGIKYSISMHLLILFVFSWIPIAYFIVKLLYKKLKSNFQNEFLNSLDKRDLAIKILLSFHNTYDGAKLLLKDFNVEIPGELDENELRRSRAEIARKRWVLTDRFLCGFCKSTVYLWDLSQKTNTCTKCSANLYLPDEMFCPDCGNNNIKIISKPSSIGKTAGLLIYGPVGLIAGTAIDKIKDSIRFGQTIKEPVFYCDSCKMKWGIKLPFFR